MSEINKFIKDYGQKKDDNVEKYSERVDKINDSGDNADIGKADLYIPDLNELSNRFDKIKNKFSNSNLVQNKIDEIK